MSETKPFSRTRLRAKGQVTLPPEVRQELGVGEGDDLAFYLNEQGQIVVARLQVIPPDQAWFWSRRWQQMERAVDAEIASGQMQTFDGVEELIESLDTAAGQAPDAED